MAKARAAAKPQGPSLGDQAIAWYRQQLSQPAPPAADLLYPPVTHGPTWQRSEDGSWLLPERTLGWQILGWTAENLLHDGESWQYTLEQARLVLHWYAVDETGRFIHSDLMLQRLKGWGKDPWAATLCAIEAFGPCRFGGWAKDGVTPLGVENPSAWVQTAAVSLDQTKNTMILFPRLFTAECRERHGIEMGKTVIHGSGGRRIEAVTSSPSTLEGARASLVILNETHHWLSNNDGHEMAAVIRRNAIKSADGAARTIRITNAYEPSQDSVAQHDREAWELVQEGRAHDSGLLLDSLEAPPEAPLTPEAVPHVIRAIRGDSVWLDIENIVKAVLDVRDPPSRSRRFWFNQIVAAEDAWVEPRNFDLMADTSKVVGPRDEVVVFFDGSKSDDATALVGCRVSDGHVFELGMWQKPAKGRGDEGWVVPRERVDAKVHEVFRLHNVVAFWADPSHALEDETQERFWDAIIDGWHRQYHDRLKLWAVNGQRGHSVMWDMTSPVRNAEFTAAAELTGHEIESTPERLQAGEELAFTWDGNGRLRQHVRNARRFPNKYGTSIWKGHRESPKKVDMAVAMIGARMLRRNVLNSTDKGRKAGKVWFPNAR